MHFIAGDGLLTIKTRAVYSYHPIAGDGLLTSKTRAVSSYHPFALYGLLTRKTRAVYSYHPIAGDGLLNSKPEQCLYASHCWWWFPNQQNQCTVGAQSIARAQSIAPRHSTYVIKPKKPKFRNFLFGKTKKEDFARRVFKKNSVFSHLKL